MKHIKTNVTKHLIINNKHFTIEGPVSCNYLKTLSFDESLNAFRPAKDQFDALKEITHYLKVVFILLEKTNTS